MHHAWCFISIGVAVTWPDDHVPHTENTHQNAHFKPAWKIYYRIIGNALFLSAHLKFKYQHLYFSLSLPRLGYQECMSETMRFMVEVEGHFPREAICVRLLNHLQKHCEALTRTAPPPPVPRPPPPDLTHHASTENNNSTPIPEEEFQRTPPMKADQEVREFYLMLYCCWLVQKKSFCGEKLGF